MTIPHKTRSNELQDCFLSASTGKITLLSQLELEGQGAKQAGIFTRLRKTARARKEFKHNTLGRLAACLKPAGGAAAA